MRSRKTTRSDRIFDDPLATQFASAEAFAFLAQHEPENNANPYVSVRRRFFYDFLLAKQVPLVILASGMNTQAYRLAWVHDTKYELEQAEVLIYKQAILKDILPTYEYYAIAAELTQPWTHLLTQEYRADC